MSTALAPLDVRAPSPPPTLASFAGNLYDALEPVAWQDGLYGWALAHLSAAIGTMFQAAEDLARDTAEGPGWSSVMDLERCPDDWLPWLGQFHGVTVPATLTGDAARAWVAGAGGFARGTVASMTAAAQATLTS